MPCTGRDARLPKKRRPETFGSARKSPQHIGYPVVTTAENTNAPSQNDTVIAVLTALSVCHLLNDMMQSLLPSIYPILKDSYQLDFSQIGFITLAFQLTASLLQPIVGMYTDRYPKPYSAAIGMGMTVIGLGLLATAKSYPLLLVAAAFVGVGSSIFHPNHRASPGSLPAAAMASRSRCSRSAAMSVPPSAPCSPPSSSCPMARKASPGSWPPASSRWGF